MYLFIGLFTLDAHQNAHQVEANQKHIESILFTGSLVFKIHGQCASYDFVLIAMQLLRVIKWPMRLSFYCCLTALSCT